MTTTTLPTSRPVTQDWNQDFEWLNGVHYPAGFYDSIGWRGHNGIDYGCWVGDPVEAVCDGVIDFAGDGSNHWLLSGGGNALLLRCDDLGVSFEYLHLSRFAVTQGQHVKRGQVIAYSGNTGISTAPHLHIGAIPIYNVNVNNGYRGRVDPTPFLYGPTNPDYAGLAAQGTITTPPKEDTLSAAEVKAINAHATKEADRIIEAVNEYTGKLLVAGYNIGGKKFPGIAAVDINNQKTIRATLALVQELAANPNMSAEQVKAAVGEALAEGTVDVDVTFNGRPEV